MLHVEFDRIWRYAQTREEMSALVSEAMANLKSEGHVMVNGRPYPTNGGVAYFSFADRRLSGEGGPDTYPDNGIAVSVNRSTGYGALVWFVTPRFKRGGIYDSAWVSDNPEPPGFDPRVVADPSDSVFHEPANTLPLPRIKEALEEFCQIGTGDRPESIKWVQSSLIGKRMEERRDSHRSDRA
jgi:hypothetical protein